MFNKITSLIKDILFPIFCARCGKEGEWWCQACRAGLALESEVAPRPYLDRITTLGAYREGEPLARLIRDFKYRYAQDSIKFWKDCILESGFKTNALAIIPVPLHTRRSRERGFNQAALIAEALGQSLGIPVVLGSLVRVRYTRQQARLNKASREENVRAAFAWRGETPPRHLLLVDDVYTTGATMQECARVLRTAGAEVAEGFALARD